MPLFMGETLRFDCIAWWSWDFISPQLELGWHGLPSLTNTGTATRRGDGSGCKSSPFSCRARFNLYLWFWNQIFTCVGVNRIMLAKCSLSGADKYLCCLNLRSSSYVCAFENRIRRLRFFCDSELFELFWESPSVMSSSSASFSESSSCSDLMEVLMLSCETSPLEWLDVLPGEWMGGNSEIIKLPKVYCVSHIFLCMRVYYMNVKRNFMIYQTQQETCVVVLRLLEPWSA